MLKEKFSSNARHKNNMMGLTFRPTPNCTSSDPSQKVLLARPLEYFKDCDSNTKYFTSKILGPILCIVTNLFRLKKYPFDRIKGPTFGEGSGEKYFWRGVG